jgi:acyl-CoA synthetase (AMP-forming)/AMP-acid ligase II
MRLQDYLDYQARQHPDAPFAVFGQRSMSYREARESANRIANALVADGLAKGDRVAVLAKNSLDYMLLYYGSFKAGVVPVPLNYRLAGPEWSYIIQDAEARAVIASGGYVAEIEKLRPELRKVERFIASDTDAPAGWEPYARWSCAQAPTQPDVDVSDADDVYQMYTSGTTGRPKGAVLTHRAVSSNIAQFATGISFGPGDRYLIVAPLYHAAAAVGSFWIVAMGGCLYVQEDFVPADVIRVLSEDHVAGATLVPAMIQACLVMVPDAAERKYDDLRCIVYGASPIAEETLRQAMNVFGCDFVQGYGMTETTAALTFLMPEDHERALRGRPDLLLSAGRPLVGTEVRIVDDRDQPVPNGTVGQVIARGPQLMRGYWNLPGASAEALKDGWMHTGDAARMDDEGYIYIQDRVKDMIVSGGENVYPREIEDVLYQHPAIAEAAVIGVPDDQWGEGVKAIVVLRDGQSATEDELIEFCRGQLAGFKRPRSVDFIDALPRNPSGKVLKRELREPYWEGQTRRVS